jgi:hypothetical protein
MSYLMLTINYYYYAFQDLAEGGCDEVRVELRSAYVSIRQHTSAYVSIRQHMSAYVSIRHLDEGGCDEVRVEVRGYSMRLTIKKHQHIREIHKRAIESNT